MSDTPKTDAFEALVNRPMDWWDWARQLERENADLRQALADMPTCRCGLSTDEQCALSVQNAALRKDKERLDSGTILLTVNGERVHHVRVDLRAAIDAARKEAQP